MPYILQLCSSIELETFNQHNSTSNHFDFFLNIFLLKGKKSINVTANLEFEL